MIDPPAVLWIEDSPDDVLLMQLAAAETALAGRLEVATTGEEAMRQAERATAEGHPFGVVLCDLRLGTETGWDVIERMRDGGVESTFVVLSSSSDERDVNRTEELGCRHLTKPMSLDGWRAIAEDIAGLVQPDR